MNIGIVGGTGPAGTGLAARLASIGHEVIVGSRTNDRAAEITEDLIDKWAPQHTLNISPGTNDTAAHADIVVMATPWDSTSPTAASIESRLTGKLVICMANALVRVGEEFHALYPPRGSIAADLQAAIPKSRVVAALHHLPARELGDLDHPMTGDVLVCSDHDGAVAEASAIINGMPDLRALDCGRLWAAAPVEAFTAVLLDLNRRYKTRTAVKFTGIPEKD